jgi:hypothetical protein
MTDATCYESYIRCPGDVKILWEPVEWLYREMCMLYKSQGLRKPRTKYDRPGKRFHSCCKKRKPRRSRRTVLTRSLLHLLNKIIGLTAQLLSSRPERTVLSPGFGKRYRTVRKVYARQRLRFQGQKVRQAIAGIDKPYIRPTVRGREVRKVESGAKVNPLQTNGINFIGHFSYEAFNGGVRLQESILRQQRLFHRRVKQAAADSIYATNANRRYCSSRSIATGFVRKGRAGAHGGQVSLMRALLSKERSTRLEGSFGTEKNRYSLQKVKARCADTEMLWILFGIHTANAVRMIEKMDRLLLQDSA